MGGVCCCSHGAAAADHHRASTSATKQCAVFIIHGTEDEEVPCSHGEMLHAAAQAPHPPYWVEGAGHSDIVEVCLLAPLTLPANHHSHHNHPLTSFSRADTNSACTIHDYQNHSDEYFRQLRIFVDGCRAPKDN